MGQLRQQAYPHRPLWQPQRLRLCNQLQIDSVDVSGYSNNVTYHSGSPKVTRSGDGTVVKQG
jgi:Protein of unknown function (DUF3060)